MPRTVIVGHHHILSLYGHGPPNDPRGSGSFDFIDDKFAALGPIHHWRKPPHEQPTRAELRDYHKQVKTLLNFQILWIDEIKRAEISQALGDVIRACRYTAYACAVCSNHLHLVTRVHRDAGEVMWNNFAEAIRQRLRLCFPPPKGEISAHHPVISARPYVVYLHTPDDMRGRIAYFEDNPGKEGLVRQRFDFVIPYDGWPLHKARGLRS